MDPGAGSARRRALQTASRGAARWASRGMVRGCPLPACSKAEHLARRRLRSKLQLALAGLLLGRRSTGRPSACACFMARADSPPLCATSRSPAAAAQAGQVVELGVFGWPGPGCPRGGNWRRRPTAQARLRTCCQALGVGHGQQVHAPERTQQGPEVVARVAVVLLRRSEATPGSCPAPAGACAARWRVAAVQAAGRRSAPRPAPFKWRQHRPCQRLSSQRQGRRTLAE
jgi:hypothetical protein